ncbi:hypothetical protein JG688_00009148 [Phytophthora aleatoria]|uniref:Srp40 C-terminal domain-containing protein n=1 Tax=Phytophthora aleatoria TaxID=2496075 RepID=A0A8J5IRR6_9STRA|nr:hypothetical protein JG688_00009148 [Phytophthora aleatoria]
MVVASDVFPLVHALLTDAGLKKSAAALAKEAKLQPKAFKSEHDLLDVYNFYLTHNMKKAKVPATSVVDAAKRPQKKKGESSSSSDSSDSSEDKKASVKKVTSSSEEESDSSEEEKPKAKAKSAVKKEESSSNEEEKPKSNKRKAEAPAAEKNSKKAKRGAESSSDDSSSSDSSDSDSDSDSDSSEDEEAQKKEAARREQAAKAALEWQPKKIEKVATKDKAAGTPFQRVDGEYWSQKIVDDTLRDNSYEGTFGVDGVGVKANNKLLKTRGKDFTKGKNKLKRSTYMCGAISMASNSFKFED